MKKLVLAVTICVLLSFAATASAAGPWYIYYNGFCNVKRIFTLGNSIHGEEVGCGTSGVLGGGRTRTGASLAYVAGAPILDVFSLNGTLRGYANNGGSLTQFATATWRLGGAPTQTTLNALRSLPEWNP